MTGGGLAGKIGHPERMLRIDLVGQAGFERGAVLLRAAPVQPAARRRGVGGGRQEFTSEKKREKTSCERNSKFHMQPDLPS